MILIKILIKWFCIDCSDLPVPPCKKSNNKIKLQLNPPHKKNKNLPRETTLSKWETQFLRASLVFKSRLSIKLDICGFINWSRLRTVYTGCTDQESLLFLPNKLSKSSPALLYSTLTNTDLNSRITLIVPAQEMRRPLSIFYSPARGGGHTPTIPRRSDF